MVRGPAQLTGSMSVSPSYDVMNVGITDTLMLLGHDANLPLNDPRPVGSIREMLVNMGPNTNSPLLKGMLEAYYAGNRDMWVMAVAPLSEYESDLDERDTSYYQTYRDRLNIAYDQLLDMGVEDLIVPIDAPFNSTVDFLGPLLKYCVNRYNNHGKICLGFLGTRGPITQSDVDALSQDSRINSVGTAGKFISIFVGDGSFTLGELPNSYTQSVAGIAAATFSTLPPNRGLTYRRLPNVVRTAGIDLTHDQLDTLASAGLNPITVTAQGRRGQPFEVVAASDNTLAPEASDYWSLTQLRLIKTIVSEIHRMGIRRMNSPTIDHFRHEVDSYLIELQSNNMLRDYSFNARRAANDPFTIEVDLSLRPFFGLKTVELDLLVAPGEEEF